MPIEACKAHGSFYMPAEQPFLKMFLSALAKRQKNFKDTTDHSEVAQ
jgi:hypothetical protein